MRWVTGRISRACGWAGCSNIGRVTVSLSTSESAPGTAEADVLVIGVIQTPDGPSAAPGADGVDEALGSTLADALTALGATGELEELVKIPGGGKRERDDLPLALVPDGQLASVQVAQRRSRRAAQFLGVEGGAVRRCRAEPRGQDYRCLLYTSPSPRDS